MPMHRSCSSSTSTSIVTGPLDYAVYNRDISGLASLSDGRNLVYAQNLATGDEEAFFATDHKTNSGNTVLYVCAEQLGLTGADAGKAVDVAGFAVDFFTSGTVRDTVGFEAVFGGERYYGLVDGEPFFTSIGTGATASFDVFDAGATGTSPDEQGVLIRVLNGDAAAENVVVDLTPSLVHDREAPGRRPGASSFSRPSPSGQVMHGPDEQTSRPRRARGRPPAGDEGAIDSGRRAAPRGAQRRHRAHLRPDRHDR